MFDRCSLSLDLQKYNSKIEHTLRAQHSTLSTYISFEMEDEPRALRKHLTPNAYNSPTYICFPYMMLGQINLKTSLA